MNNSIKLARVIAWVFFALLLVVSIIGVLNISNKIPITYTISGPNWEGSKFFIFLYPIVSLYIAMVGIRGLKKKENPKLKGNLLLIIIGNLVLGGLLVYTVLTNWIA